MGRRVVSIHLPRLAAERRLRREGGVEGVFAVVGEIRGALTLVSVTAEAEAAGLRAGMGLADARAIRPDLATRPAQPQAEAAFLAALVRWAGRWSPWVAPEEADGLVLDVTGCAHLFGGEAAMLADMTGRLAAQGLTARAAAADTRGAAWALARWATRVGPASHHGDTCAVVSTVTLGRFAT
jgi:Nucleotidyltransferase/DNA polymerase involved in DNA repair